MKVGIKLLLRHTINFFFFFNTFTVQITTKSVLGSLFSLKTDSKKMEERIDSNSIETTDSQISKIFKKITSINTLSFFLSFLVLVPIQLI